MSAALDSRQHEQTHAGSRRPKRRPPIPNLDSTKRRAQRPTAPRPAKAAAARAAAAKPRAPAKATAAKGTRSKVPATKRTAAERKGAVARPRGSGGRGGAARPARSPRAPKTRAEQPLGAGVGDAFAVRRLMKEGPPPRQSAVREIGWAEFGALAAALAERIGTRFKPDVVLGIMNAGVFVGGALAPTLGAELLHLHLPGRGEGRLPSLVGKRVLVVDDAAGSGRTLARAAALAKKGGASEVRTAVIVLRPGGARPDWYALESEELAVFGWDYQFHGNDGSSDPGDAGV